MELTKQNYYEYEQQIIKDIKESEFISFDIVVTGVGQYHKLLESPKEYFSRCLDTAGKYRIIQLSLVPFIYNRDTKTYAAKPYYIYVFPSEKQHNNHLDFESSSMIANSKRGIDFNKWICDGVPYLNNENLNKLSDRLLTWDINKYNPKDQNQYKPITLFKEIDKERYKKFITKFNEFYNNENEKTFKYEKMMKHLMIYFVNKCDENIINNIYIEYKDNFVIFHKLTNHEEKIKKILTKENENIQIIKKEQGIKNLFDVIIYEKKPLIGHNCYQEILFIMNHFIGEIPSEYKTFKLSASNKFNGGIFDTKYIFTNSTLDFFEDKSKDDYQLEDLFTYLFQVNKERGEEGVKIEIPSQFENYFETEKKFEQVGYDAFVSGCCFAYLKNIIGNEYIEKQRNKINFYCGIYSCMDLSNEKEEEIYLKNATQILIVNYLKKALNEENLKEIDKIVNDKVVLHKIESGKYEKKIVYTVIFIKKENQDEFIKKFEGLKNIIEVMELQKFYEYRNTAITMNGYKNKKKK